MRIPSCIARVGVTHRDCAHHNTGVWSPWRMRTFREFNDELLLGNTHMARRKKHAQTKQRSDFATRNFGKQRWRLRRESTGFECASRWAPVARYIVERPARPNGSLPGRRKKREIELPEQLLLTKARVMPGSACVLRPPQVPLQTLNCHQPYITTRPHAVPRLRKVLPWNNRSLNRSASCNAST